VTAPARAVFALLVAASVVAFFVTQRLKHTPTVLQRVLESNSFAPGVHDHELEKISFKTKQADLVTVSIKTTGGAYVAALVTRAPMPRYRQCRVDWNGLTSAGRLAPPGSYTAWFAFERQDRTIPAPRSFRLERRVAAPSIPPIRHQLVCVA
jgi:hypothetical protein